tara:strand:- start:106 stop:258 length:153 start_codon:yes stop_codon:yes gene_type:complete
LRIYKDFESSAKIQGISSFIYFLIDQEIIIYKTSHYMPIKNNIYEDNREL